MRVAVSFYRVSAYVFWDCRIVKQGTLSYPLFFISRATLVALLVYSFYIAWSLAGIYIANISYGNHIYGRNVYILNAWRSVPWWLKPGSLKLYIATVDDLEIAVGHIR